MPGPIDSYMLLQLIGQLISEHPVLLLYLALHLCIYVFVMSYIGHFYLKSNFPITLSVRRPVD